MQEIIMLSIILPAHNEEKRISNTLDEYCSFFPHAEIIVSLNACSDKTKEIIQEYQKAFPNLKYIESEIGAKGNAIIEGFKVARGDYIGFVDADCSTSAKEFRRLANKIQSNDGVIASRYLPESIVEPKQSWKRILVSRIFNGLINLLLGLGYSDTQCGAKIFKRKVIDSVLPDLKTTKWAFDIDLLYQIKKQKIFKVQEIATEWRDAEYSHLNIMKAGPNMFLAVVRLRLLYSPFKFIVDIYDKIK